MFVIVALVLSLDLYAGDAPNLSKGGSYPASTGNPFVASGYGGQCTAYSWGRAYEKLNKKLPVTKSAKFWASQVGTSYEVDMTLQANSIVVWGGDKYNTYGHVAFVEKIKDGYVYISEANWNTFQATKLGGGYDGYVKKFTLAQHKAYRKQAGSIIGYIHLQPSTPTTPLKITSIKPVCPTVLNMGDVKSCTATAYYSNGTNKDITSGASWSVMTNSTVLKVSGGKLTVLGAEKDTVARVKITYPNATANGADITIKGLDGQNPKTYQNGLCLKDTMKFTTNIKNGKLHLFYSKTCKTNFGILEPTKSTSKTKVKIVREGGGTQSYEKVGTIYTPMLFSPSKKVCVYGSVNGATESKGSCK